MDNKKVAILAIAGTFLVYILLRARVKAESGFAPTELRISPTYPVVGQFVAISIVLQNITTEVIEYSLTMYLNGADLGTSIRELDPGQSREPAFEVTNMITSPGTYTASAKLINLGTGVELNFSKTFTVE